MFFSFLQLIVNEQAYAFQNGFYAEWKEVYIKYTSIMQSKLAITSLDLRFTPLALELSGEISALKLQNKELEIINGDLAFQIKNHLVANNQVLDKLPPQIARSFWFYPPGALYDLMVGSVQISGGILLLIKKLFVVYKDVGFSGVLIKFKQLVKSQKASRAGLGYSSWIRVSWSHSFWARKHSFGNRRARTQLTTF
jgi:hypothetical protein